MNRMILPTYIRKVLVAGLMLLLSAGSVFAVTDSYKQSFDSLTDGSTVNTQDSFTVSEGDPENAMIESGETSTGGGKALKLTGAVIPVDVSRPAVYGNTSPTWVEYVVKASMGADRRDVPADGIGAVTFSPTGKIMVSDRTTWVDTGKTFTPNTWYRVLMKLDFSTHMYDVYCENVSSPLSPFIPQKQNLHFIDPAISTLGQVGFKGTYNISAQSDSMVDEFVVHHIDRLQFTTSPQTIVKGHPSSLITVQLQSANSESQTAWRDIEIELRSSVQNGEFSADKDTWVPISTLIIPEGSQQVSFYYTDYTEGRPTLTVNEFPDRGWTDATQEQKVVSEGDYFTVSATTPQVAGVPFTLQIAAMDGAGGLDTTYGGTVDISVQYVQPLTGGKVVTPFEATGFLGGLKDIELAYPDAGSVKIMVRDRDDSMKVGYSGEIFFMPASFEVNADPVQIVGKNFPVTVRAVDKDGKVTPNYQGPANIQAVPVNPASTSGVFNPVEIQSAAFQSGLATLNTSFDRWGVVGIKALDTAHPEKFGTSMPVQFLPKTISVSVTPPSNTRPFFYNGENMEVSVSVLGEDDMPIQNFQGTVSFTATPSFGFPSQYVFSDSDKGQKKFIVPAGAAGKYKLKAEDVQNALSVESDEFEVKEATIVVSSTSAPVGATTVEIQLVDKNGKRIKEENELRLTILISEENDNGSVFFSEAGKPLLFTKGLAKIVIGDGEAEVVNISARSKFGLNVINGKVIFGRAGSTGVGTLMLRESKD